MPKLNTMTEDERRIYLENLKKLFEKSVEDSQIPEELAPRLNDVPPTNTNA